MGIYGVFRIMGLSGLFLCISFCVVLTSSLQAQDETHYINALNRAKALYNAGEYARTIEKIEIALFGIVSDRKAMAECYVYLSLSHFFLKNQEQARENLQTAQSYLDEEGFMGLGLDEDVLFNLESLWYLFNPKSSIFPGKTGPASEDSTIVFSDDVIDSTIRSLEQQVKDNPRYVASYYDLYEAYSYKGDEKKAKKTMEELVKNKPRETKAYFLLGKMEYQERKYKDAVKHLEQFFALLGNMPLETRVIQEAAAYHILATNAKDGEDRSLLQARKYAHLLIDESIEDLALSPQDKLVLRGIMRKARRCP